ncbi:MAG: NAD(P)-binding protein [Rhodospirillaceae bacterium]|jgi:glutamate synthase (NADPH) small chain|nr:NAD(P)-binding protein [Rhodospirillaceae bacterium]MBT4218450.1 NAD(P)-binding protein [Rhodospirillaceae bacterium]MBT5013433.1 NAD(P)-binding protein [Rhodospirillaceae bacterium]MBT6407129.1 NAD(P)-binding protein [Rhodospirillaceae bacterium]MBT7355821.1 NAD(P)-binding protein [Rhodospirillaceae bacterium]
MTATADKKLSYRRYEEGETVWDDFTDKIFQAGYSHKCPTYVHRTPPCQGSCPSGHDIRGWLAIARGQDKPAGEETPWQQYAFERMVESNPFPSVMGRVCPAPCESGCNRNEVDDFVGINSVEHYVGDWAIENNMKLEAAATESGKKVAVIGGGPAGLAAAYQLRKKGHGVTIFEEHDQLGGMMRFGIPGYRTPREMLDNEIGRITDMGVEVRTSTRVGKDISMEDVDKDYDAVFWAIGAQSGRPLPIDGADATNCITGVAFLDSFNQGKLQHVTGRIIVVGGGDTSIDVASVARRLGHIETINENDRPEMVVLGHTAHDVATTAVREGADVTLTSLFPIDEMMAAEREREDAKSEGVDLRGGIMPLEVIVNSDGRATALKLCECEMDGATPVAKEGTEFEIECDLIVSAIGQSGRMDGLDDLDNGKGFIDTGKNYQVTGKAKHFAGGDIIRPHLLTTAIGHASIAVDGIDQFLQGEEVDDKRPKVDVHHFNLLSELHQRHLDPTEYDHTATRGTSDEDFAVHNYEDRSANQIVAHDDLFLGHFGFEVRNHRVEKQINAEDVLGNFEERIQSLSEEGAQTEGGRCMSCGMCFECDNCVVYCPQDAVFRVKRDKIAVGRYVDTDYSRCIGCHICMDVCPTGYIQMGLGE